MAVNLAQAGSPVLSVAGKTGAVTLVEGDVANLVTDLAAKAPLASPALTGTPTAPTQTALDNSTKIATTAYVDVVKPRVVASRILLAQSAVDGSITAATLFTVPVGGAGVYRVSPGLSLRTKSSSAWQVNVDWMPPSGTNIPAQLGMGVTMSTGAVVSQPVIYSIYLHDADVISCGTVAASGANTGGVFDVSWIVERLS